MKLNNLLPLAIKRIEMLKQNCDVIEYREKLRKSGNYNKFDVTNMNAMTTILQAYLKQLVEKQNFCKQQQEEVINYAEQIRKLGNAGNGVALEGNGGSNSLWL